MPIDLTGAGHKIDLTSGHEYKKSKIYKLLELVTLLRTAKSLTTGAFITVAVPGCPSC